VLIAHGVTIGGRSRQPGMPVIEDDVYIAPGAKILGDVHIGHDSLIGANAVVVSSVPPGSLVVGVPGVVKRSGIRARDLEDW
jgi:serine O-acetyltransferase